jgi:hypothetical protein
MAIPFFLVANLRHFFTGRSNGDSYSANGTAMLRSGLASLKMQGKKQPMMPESSEAGASQKIGADAMR